mmetsp:Transcript_18581/g.38662  ORF Transcript_18581/g.38662 Transcript_18581/m.38662 type:complete len:788 (+) Transcript_18581:96-2459(+)
MLRCTIHANPLPLSTGGAGYALHFDGFEDHIRVSVPDRTCRSPSNSAGMISSGSAVYNPLATNTSFTMSTWFMWDQVLNEYQWIMGFGGDAGIRLVRSGLKTDQLEFISANQADPCRTILLPLNILKEQEKWHHVTVVWDAPTYTFYIDGNATVTQTCSGYPGKFTTYFDIGGDHAQPYTRNMPGSVDEFRFYNRSLSKEEVQNMMRRTLTAEEITTDSSLILYHQFDVGKGLNSADSSRNGIDGILGGISGLIADRPRYVRSQAPFTGADVVVDADVSNCGPKHIYEADIRTLFDTGELVDSASTEAGQVVSIVIISNTFDASVSVSAEVGDIVQQSALTLTLDCDYIASQPLGPISGDLTYSVVVGSTIFHEVNGTVKLFLSPANTPPRAGNSGSALFFDGIDDFVHTSDFFWPKNDTSVTIEWWGLTSSTDMELDELQASGASLWSLGNEEVVGNWCPDDLGDESYKYCGGRFQAHTPWVDGGLSWDFGWQPGIKGRVSKDMSEDYGKWTHYAMISSPEGANAIFLDGEIFASSESEPTAPEYDNEERFAKATCADDKIPPDITPPDTLAHDMRGLWIGGWPFWELYHRGTVDEFRVWNTARSQEEIQANMYKHLQPQPGLRAYYTFDDEGGGNQLGTIFEDFSGEGNHLESALCANPEYHGGRTNSKVPCYWGGQGKGGENVTHLSTAAPEVVESFAPVAGPPNDQVVFSPMNSTHALFTINGTDVDAMDKLQVIVIVAPSKGTLAIVDTNRKKMNAGTSFSWSIEYTPESQSSGGERVDNFT